ncbi:DegT/DnrJ/EryC1/StrS family aminotransferase [Quadrisphaera granulorum]|nr:DegT/DnrJ/EryC1/StrS family aminotransferase [Quadrisphaera granulorum]
MRDLERAFAEQITSGEFIGGSSVRRFEEQWALACGTPHAIGVANGTDALELALRGLGIGLGDEVVVPANTFIATAHAVISTGARVVFADVDPVTLLVTPASVTEALTPRTRAVIVVHLFGHAADVDEIGRLARQHGLFLVEDCAQAHGATWAGRPVGSFGDAGCFSFYPSKNLGALGDGGAVVTADSALASAIRQIADHGRSTTDRNSHVVAGRNSRLDATQAAALSVKLGHLSTWNEQRRAAHATYQRSLSGADGVRLQQEPAGSRSVYHLEVVRVVDRERVEARLRAAGIATSVHYPVPCHLQPSMSCAAEPQSLPVAEVAASQILSLPMFPGISDAQVERVCDVLLDSVAVITTRVGGDLTGVS